MIKLLSIVGARPQIIKSAAISRAVMKYQGIVKEEILHTGQHYDSDMSQIFFDELKISKPDFNLGVGSGLYGEQIAKMIAGIEKVLISEDFDGVILYGDTNSTLAGAVAASKLHVPVFHIEAGLRSYDMSMPEEINRIVCDHVSSLLFAPTETAINNLRNEGLFSSKAVFANGKTRMVYNSGDIMYDNSVYYTNIAKEKSDFLTRYDLKPNEFVLATVHRANNTDDKGRLSSIFKALMDISTDRRIKIVMPLHPRTSKLLVQNLGKDLYNRIISCNNLIILPPVSFLGMICLEKNAKIIITDSGGVQKESFFYEKPCIVLRSETEWVEIIENNAGIIADADYGRIIKAYDTLSCRDVKFPKIYGDGHSAEFIMEKIIEYLS